MDSITIVAIVVGLNSTTDPMTVSSMQGEKASKS
jgi:hypothetical protein